MKGADAAKQISAWLCNKGAVKHRKNELDCFFQYQLSRGSRKVVVYTKNGCFENLASEHFSSKTLIKKQ